MTRPNFYINHKVAISYIVEEKHIRQEFGIIYCRCGNRPGILWNWKILCGRLRLI